MINLFISCMSISVLIIIIIAIVSCILIKIGKISKRNFKILILGSTAGSLSAGLCAFILLGIISLL